MSFFFRTNSLEVYPHVLANSAVHQNHETTVRSQMEILIPLYLLNFSNVRINEFPQENWTLFWADI